MITERQVSKEILFNIKIRSSNIFFYIFLILLSYYGFAKLQDLVLHFLFYSKDIGETVCTREKQGICWFLLKVRCECIRIDLHPEPVCHSCPDNLKACEKKNCKSSCTYHHKTYRCCDCPPPACFPSAANVYLKNGKCVQMVELEIGDHVQSGIIVLRM